MALWLKKIVLAAAGIAAAAGIFVFLINGFVVFSTKDRIVTEKEAEELEDVDCILVLGAGVRGMKPTPMLKDRLDKGIELYDGKVSERLLMSGDHGQEDYDEVSVMKKYAVSKGVRAKHIFMDHAGFSTYESVYRAKEVFRAEKVIIVTQKYHLYRALYAARQLGLEAYGVAADTREYSGQTYREIREALARNKEWLNCIVKPEPKYLGEAIPVSGNGNVTDDRQKEESGRIR